jgi:hypothetical protein
MNERNRIMEPCLVPVRQKSKARDNYGIFMTLCIGAIAENQNKIVTVTDFMLSNSITSMDGRASKVTRIGRTKRWMVMFSGDPSVAQKILGAVDRDLQNHPTETDEEVMNAFTRAHQNPTLRKLRPYSGAGSAR